MKIKILLGFILGYLLLILGSKFIIFNITASLPRGIYLLSPAKDIKKGDIVVFEIPDKLKECQYIPKFTNIILKEVGALEEDIIQIKEDNLLINNKIYGKIYIKDSLGTYLPKLNLSELKPLKDEFLPLAPAQNSYDGRYYGTVKISKIKNKANLILKFD